MDFLKEVPASGGIRSRIKEANSKQDFSLESLKASLSGTKSEIYGIKPHLILYFAFLSL
ncbi:uncharacterized protein AFUA_8G07010 [Aspergillus fumigatus Af293]|uniref:Uncharacterized protein n=1 Tax=Aspergillus fumigatus (strain ATCC MYA-4609 / CBS 101355 / FGSC A1100 / Af293) TaxID=330879 RepID=Q4WBS3_ASPFU|nr:hypothetical protein AFUA_8G07010 [Aspergillus fumigatus Af293]EAL85461.1 hypothetical protein AFUA_8G07010 [Aspergillus fumigatus Af293]